MRKFLSIVVIFAILSLVFPAGVFAANRVAQLPLESNLPDPYGELTFGAADRASDAWVVNPDNLMVHYRGNGENLVEDSDDLTAGNWSVSGGGTVNSATLFTFAGGADSTIFTNTATEEGKTYILSFKIRAISGNTSIRFFHNGSATGITSALTITATLTRYSVAVLGKIGSGNVGFGVRDNNASGHGQIEFTEIQVEETSVPINELEDETGYETKYHISLANGQSYWGADKLGADLFDAGAGIFTSGTYSWTVYGTNTIANVGNTLQITWVDDAGGAHLELSDAEDLTSDLTILQLYKIQLDASINTGSAEIHIYNQAGSSIYSVTVDKSELQTFNLYFLATHATGDHIRMLGMGAGEVMTLDNITIQAVTSPADFADSGFLLQVTDGGGNKASGYIGRRGEGETVGGELLSNPSFDVNTTGWTPADSAVLASVAGGVSNNSFRITEGGADNPQALAIVVTVANKEYKYYVWVKQGTESTYGIRFFPTTYSNVGPNFLESSGVWLNNGVYGVASDSSEKVAVIQFAASGAATTIFFDEASFKEVTEPNPNSVKIYKTNALASQGWMIEDGFDPNDIASWVIRDNRLGDTEPRVFAPTSGATATIPAEAAFNDKGLVNIGPVTNWLLQSNGFDEASWTNTATITQNETDIAGDANTAWTIEDDNAGSVLYLLQDIAKNTSDTNIYTFILYIKKDSNTSRFPQVQLGFRGVSTKDYNIRFNTATGATNVTNETPSNTSHEVLDRGDWWQFVLSASDNGSNDSIRINVQSAYSNLFTGGAVVAAVGSIIICHAMLTRTPYALPFYIPTLSVPVTTTSQVVPWTMGTFKKIFSDAVGGSESEGTLIASWTPYYDEADDSTGNYGIIGVIGLAYGLVYIKAGTPDITSYDGANISDVGLSFTKNTTYILIVRWSKRQNKLQVSIISAGVLTNGTATSYDGAFELGTDLIIGFGNNYPFSLGEVHFYGEWIVDGKLGRYPALVGDGGATWW